MKKERVQKVIQEMKKDGVNQLVICSVSSIFYLTGIHLEPGERLFILYLTSDGMKKLIVNSLFQIHSEVDRELEIVEYTDSENSVEVLKQVISDKGRLGIDGQWQAKFVLELIGELKSTSYVLGSKYVDYVRMIKDSEEIAYLREASRVNDLAMGALVEAITEGKEEKVLAKELVAIYNNYGADIDYTCPIVSYGINCVNAHHVPDETKLNRGDCVVLDIGVPIHKYCSDMTRTVFYKGITEEMKRVYYTVLQAQLKAIDLVKPGVRGCTIDQVARDFITKAGYGQYFTHRTGHNIGIDVHEYPSINEMNMETIQEGMVFSIEPGIYIPGVGGVRIEDLVVVTKTGVELLNHYTKELQIIKG